MNKTAKEWADEWKGVPQLSPQWKAALEDIAEQSAELCELRMQLAEAKRLLDRVVMDRMLAECSSFSAWLVSRRDFLVAHKENK